MNLLAFDTSTETMALGVSAQGRRHTALAPGGAAASATLLPRIEALLAQAGIALGALDAIAFGRGPGALTGLRASCAVAQGLGFGLGRPLVPIDSLLVVAEDARAQAGGGTPRCDVAVAMDARMDEAYAARYRFDGSRWHMLEAPALCTAGALEAAWQRAAPTVVAGSALAAFGARLHWPPGARRVEHEHDRAAALLHLAEEAFARGEAVDAAAALPLYLRDKVALTSAEREAARAAPGAAR